MPRFRMLLALGIALVLTVPAVGAGAQAPRSPVTLTFGLWDQTQQPVMQQLVNKFEASHPGIKITIQQTPFAAYFNKLATEAAAGSEWDVFWMNPPFFPTYATKGNLLNLDPYLKADKFPLSRYPKGTLDSFISHGHHYGLPKDFDTIGLWYNKTLFNKAKIPFPKCNLTWKGFAALSKRLKDAHAAQYGTLIWNEAVQQIYGGLFPSFGGSFLNKKKTRSVVASKHDIKALNILQGMIKNGSAMPGPSNGAGANPQAVFESGKIAMIVDGSFEVKNYTSTMKNYKLGLTCIPRGPKGNISVIAGVGMVANGHTKYPKQAAKFIEYMSGPQAAKLQAKTGIAIPALNHSQGAFIASHRDLDLKAFLQETKKAVAFPSALGFNQWNDAIVSDFDPWLLGRQSAKVMLTKLQKDMNAVLVKYYQKP